MMRWLISILLVILLSTLPTSVVGAKSSTDHDVLANQAYAAFQKGDFAESEKLWDEFLLLEPNEPAGWGNRGNVLLSQQKLTRAVEDYTKAIELAPNSTDPYLNRGIAFELMQEWDRAIEDYTRVIALKPKDALGYNNLGNALAGKGQWQEALRDYEKAVAIEPKFAFARANVDLMRFQLGQEKAALDDIRKLVSQYPDFVDMRAALTAILWNASKEGEAESNWVAVMGLDNRYADLEWVKTVRRWPPKLSKALKNFLLLQQTD